MSEVLASPTSGLKIDHVSAEAMSNQVSSQCVLEKRQGWSTLHVSIDSTKFAAETRTTVEQNRNTVWQATSGRIFRDE